MKKIGARLLAEIIFAVHTALVVLLVAGWLLPVPYYYVYVAALTITFATQLVWRYCLLTAWEFYFRRILDPSINGTPYYLVYYSYKLFSKRVNEKLVDRLSLVFLSVSLAFAGLHMWGIL